MVENFRPGTLDGVGLDAATLTARHPRLIYCSISGYGQTGPRRDEPGYDAVIQAEGGLMSITGDADGPPYRLGVAIADIVSGMFAAQGVLAALVARERTGQGQVVDIGMLDAVTALLTYQAGNYFATGAVPGRLGNRHPTIAPYETFATADGDIAVAIGNDSLWQRFCAAAGARRARRRSAARHQRRPAGALRRDEAAARRGLPRAPAREWRSRLLAAGVPCGDVRDLGEVLRRSADGGPRDGAERSPHPTLGEVRVTGVPVKLSETPGAVRTSAPPLLGQHTRAVLGELGYDQARIDALAAAGAVAWRSTSDGDDSRSPHLAKPPGLARPPILGYRPAPQTAPLRHRRPAAASRRTDEATRQYETFLNEIATPVFRLMATALRGEGRAVRRDDAVGRRAARRQGAARRRHRARARHHRRPAGADGEHHADPRPPRDAARASR